MLSSFNPQSAICNPQSAMEAAMRLCRYSHNKQIHVGFYDDKAIVPLAAAAKAYGDATHDKAMLPAGDDLLPLLPPDGAAFAAAKKIAEWVSRNDAMVAPMRLAVEDVELLRPIARPNKLLLLAGNYNEHITEGGG